MDDVFGTTSEEEDDLGQDPREGSRPGSASRLQPRSAIDGDEEDAARLGAWSDDEDAGQQPQEPVSQVLLVSTVHAGIIQHDQWQKQHGHPCMHECCVHQSKVYLAADEGMVSCIM